VLIYQDVLMGLAQSPSFYINLPFNESACEISVEKLPCSVDLQMWRMAEIAEIIMSYFWVTHGPS